MDWLDLAGGCIDLLELLTWGSKNPRGCAWALVALLVVIVLAIVCGR